MWHFHPPEHLDWHHALKFVEIESHTLSKARQVDDNEDALFLVAAYEGEDFAVLRLEERHAAAAEGFVALPQGDQPLRPPEQRMLVLVLRLDVHGFVVVLGVDDHWQE